MKNSLLHCHNPSQHHRTSSEHSNTPCIACSHNMQHEYSQVRIIAQSWTSFRYLAQHLTPLRYMAHNNVRISAQPLQQSLHTQASMYEGLSHMHYTILNSFLTHRSTCAAISRLGEHWARHKRPFLCSIHPSLRTNNELLSPMSSFHGMDCTTPSRTPSNIVHIVLSTPKWVNAHQELQTKAIEARYILNRTNILFFIETMP